MEWDLTAAASGHLPSCKPNGQKFDDADPRASRTETRLGFRVAVIQLRGDWPAICEMVGHRTWSRGTFPCVFCDAPKSELSEFNNAGLATSPWSGFGREEYEHELALRTVRITVNTVEQRSEIFRNLCYKQKGLGRCLTRGLPEHGLQAGDRLEASPELPNAAAFELTVPPFIARFWRNDESSRLTHETPLLRIPGVHMHLYGVDLLHCWDLGIISTYIAHSFWFLLKSKVLAPAVPWANEQHSLNNSLMQLKSEMWLYYKLARQNDPTFWKRKGAQVPRCR